LERSAAYLHFVDGRRYDDHSTHRSITMSLLSGLIGFAFGVAVAAVYNHFQTKKFDALGDRIVDQVESLKAKV
jgi:uncharacterized membrane protein (DUF485 family)